jgi:hypothetical protein
MKYVSTRCRIYSDLQKLNIPEIDFQGIKVRSMVFNATFNNTSVIWWQSVLLVEETEVPEENHRPVAIQWNLYYIKLYQEYITMSGIETHNISGEYVLIA